MQYQHQLVDTTKLHPNPWNSNVVSPENEAKLDESLRRFGVYKPIVVRTLPDGRLEIIGGQHRWESAKRLGLKQVPVVNLGEIPDSTAKEISLVDNGRYGVDDATALAEILKSLGSNEELATFLPYSEKELSAIFSTADLDLEALDIKEDTEEIDLSVEAASGPVYQIMRFKIRAEDAERISALIENVQKMQGFTEADALTNAGDALVYLLLNRDHDD